MILRSYFLSLSFFCFAAVKSLHTLNDQISHFIVTKSKALEEDKDPFLPPEKETLKRSMMLMRHLLMDAQVHRSTNSIHGWWCPFVVDGGFVVVYFLFLA